MEIEHLISYNKIYIFGAQSRAKTLTGYLHYLFSNICIEAYLVDDISQNENSIDGVPVWGVDDENAWNFENPVLIATKGVYHQEIIKKLDELGFHNIIPITVDADNWLKNSYVSMLFDKQKIPFVKIEQLQDKYLSSEDNFDKQHFMIYMAKSIYDRPLQCQYVLPDYECAIQVGAALTKDRLDTEILVDCEGDNISEKNRQYCELTGLYWIWKHAKEDIVGLSHYRRHFVLPDRWQQIMIANNIDVVLPVPTYVLPSVDANYRERHDAGEWQYLMNYLKQNSSSDYEIAEVVFGGNLYSACNMFIMKREIVEELCSWMFPIIDAVVLHEGKREDTYLNRYPGFLAERLITLFFYKNRSKYRIAYADKSFLQ